VAPAIANVLETDDRLQQRATMHRLREAFGQAADILGDSKPWIQLLDKVIWALSDGVTIEEIAAHIDRVEVSDYEQRLSLAWIAGFPPDATPQERCIHLTRAANLVLQLQAYSAFMPVLARLYSRLWAGILRRQAFSLVNPRLFEKELSGLMRPNTRTFAA